MIKFPFMLLSLQTTNTLFSSVAYAVTMSLATVANAQVLADFVTPPLLTSGNQILDKYLNPIHLHCIAWSGAHMDGFVVNGLEFSPLGKLVEFIRLSKFNCVRLQFSAELVFKNPVVDKGLLEKYNPDLVGLRAIDIYHRVVQEITARKIMVILDLHMLDAGWCCDQNDDNGGWYNDRWTEKNATAQLLKMVELEKDNEYVMGVDLRNEIRPRIASKSILGLFNFPSLPFYPNWGLGGEQDWAAAAERMGNAVHSANPKLIIFVQGIFVLQPEHIFHLLGGGNLHDIKIPQSLKSVSWRPIRLNVPNKVVYSSHEYDWHYMYDWKKPVDYESYRKMAETNYGYVFDKYPLWMGEIGTSADMNGVENNQHWQFMLRYFQERKFHWAVWEFAGVERGHADPNSFSIMNRNHTGYSYIPYLESLQSIMF